jgi:hypothetical protein
LVMCAVPAFAGNHRHDGHECLCRLLPRFKVDGWCPHLHVLTEKLKLDELLPTTISDSMILRKFPPAPLAPPPGSALLAGSAGAQLLLDGVILIAREQEWRRQLEAARSGAGC